MKPVSNEIMSAVNAGLDILSPKSDVCIPVRCLDGAIHLRSLLHSIMQGKLLVVSPQELAALKKESDDARENPTG